MAWTPPRPNAWYSCLAVSMFSALMLCSSYEDLAAARARGRTGGRRPKLTDSQVKHARQLYAGGEHIVAGITGLLGASRQTVYRALEPEAPGAAGQ